MKLDGCWLDGRTAANDGSVDVWEWLAVDGIDSVASEPDRFRSSPVGSTRRKRRQGSADGVVHSSGGGSSAAFDEIGFVRGGLVLAQEKRPLPDSTHYANSRASGRPLGSTPVTSF